MTRVAPGSTREAFASASSLQQEAEFRLTRAGVAGTNNFVGLRVRGPLDRARAQHALDALMGRHEIFRTALRTWGTEVVQIVEPSASVDFDEVDLSGLTASARDDELSCVVERLLEPPFELFRTPLLRATMVRLGPTHHVLGWVVPHTIWDSGACRLFLEEFTGLLTDAPPRTRRGARGSAVQMSDFAAWQRRLQDPAAETYWSRHLEGASGRVQLPFDRSTAASYRPAVDLIPSLDATVARRLEAVAQQESTTLGTVATAAVPALLHVHTGQLHFTMTVAHANRDHAWAGRVLGSLYDFVPIRVDLDGDLTFRELLRRVSRATRDAFAHLLPGRPLLDILVEPCDIQLNFQYASAPFHGGSADCGLVFEEYRPTVSWKHFPTNGVWWGARMDINMVMSVEGALGGDLGYDADSCTAGLASTVAGAVSRTLAQFSITPDQRLSCAVKPDAAFAGRFRARAPS